MHAIIFCPSIETSSTIKYLICFIYFVTLREFVLLDHYSYVSVLVSVKQNEELFHQYEMLLFLWLQLVGIYLARVEQ